MTKPKRVPVEEAADQSLRCRDFGHAWEFQTDFQVERTKNRLTGVRRIVACIRCGVMRLDHYELPSFRRISSKYVYPNDYLLPGHQGRVPVAEIRQEILRRLLSDVKKGRKS